MQRLLHECHKVLYKQLLRWILQGSLYDPFDEFFVKSADAANIDEEKTSKEDPVLDDDSSENPLNNKFQLRVEMIPCHISVATAEKIYFIGESIQLFERDRDLDARGGVLKDKEAEFYNQLAELSESLEFKVMSLQFFFSRALVYWSFIAIYCDFASQMCTLKSNMVHANNYSTSRIRIYLILYQLPATLNHVLYFCSLEYLISAKNVN